MFNVYGKQYVTSRGTIYVVQSPVACDRNADALHAAFGPIVCINNEDHVIKAFELYALDCPVKVYEYIGILVDELASNDHCPRTLRGA